MVLFEHKFIVNQFQEKIAVSCCIFKGIFFFRIRTFDLYATHRDVFLHNDAIWAAPQPRPFWVDYQATVENLWSLVWYPFTPKVSLCNLLMFNTLSQGLWHNLWISHHFFCHRFNYWSKWMTNPSFEHSTKERWCCPFWSLIVPSDTFHLMHSLKKQFALQPILKSQLIS